MEDTTENPRRLMAMGLFEFEMGYQYFKRIQRRKITNGPVKYNKESIEHFYVVGEEDDAWAKIQKDYKNNTQQEARVRNKKVTMIRDMGYSMANRDGSIRVKPFGS